jgi:hypothetical protein
MSISSYNRVSKQLPRITLQLIRSKNTEDKIVEGNFRLERTLKSQEKEEINHHQISLIAENRSYHSLVLKVEKPIIVLLSD